MMRSNVVLPEPDGPRSQQGSLRHIKANLIKRDEVAESLGDILD